MFSRLLPAPPRYLTLPSIGLDISDTSIKYVSVSPPNRTGARTLQDWGDVDVPAGVLQRGEVTDPAQLVPALAECQLQTGARFVRVSLPEERAYLFETDIKPNTPLQEVRSLLEFRLAENVPLPAQDVFFDYTLLPAAADDRSLHVAVTAYAKETIQTYYEACRAAGLQPVAFEVEAQAMVRSTVPADSTGAVMLVDFGKTRTGIGIAYNDVLLYTSTIDVGGKHLSEAMRGVLGSDIPEAELTTRKNTQGLIRGVGDVALNKAVSTTVELIRAELATRMQYWHMRTGADPERRLSQIILCGGSANLRGLSGYLPESLHIPVHLANVWEHMFSFADTIPPIDKRHSLGYATAIGLALGTDTI